MFKPLLQWFAREVLGPLLVVLLKEVLLELVKWAIDRFRDLMRRWRREEEAAAGSDEERQRVAQRYDRRSADLDRIETEAPEAVARIIADAMKRWESERDRLLQQTPETALPPPSDAGQ